jgi:hypothetical protein
MKLTTGPSIAQLFAFWYDYDIPFVPNSRVMLNSHVIERRMNGKIDYMLTRVGPESLLFAH